MSGHHQPEAATALVRHYDDMTAVDLGQLVRLSLDPVLVPAGFQTGQCGYGNEGFQVIFCAPYAEFRQRHPRLPQARHQEGNDICVDLVVDVWADGTLGRLDLETTSVEQTLLHIGMVSDSEAVAQVVGRTLADSLPVIEAALRRLFGNPD
jgi:hypothetical protein